ncbi:MAG TPA: hypothetical protein VJC37_07165 [Planctomycetota bacterium]|nr:hypothetical protein [Planctomycetota bacterium]
MKKIFLRIPAIKIAALVLCAFVFGVSLSLAGCRSTGMELSKSTATTMNIVEGDYKLAMAQVDATRVSLEDLVNLDRPDIKGAFERYSANVIKMENMGQRLFKHSDEMKAQGKEYFEEWQKKGDAYTNLEIQALSEQRRSDLSVYFAKISEASVGVKGEFKAYISDIKEIQTYLANDLTSKGIEALTPVTQKSVKDGDRFRNSVEPVLVALGNARAELALGGVK